MWFIMQIKLIKSIELPETLTNFTNEFSFISYFVVVLRYFNNFMVYNLN